MRRYLARPWDPGMTHEEAAVKSGLDREEAHRRIPELRRKGLLEVRFNTVTKRPHQRLMSKGKAGQVYWITKKGIRKVEDGDYDDLTVEFNHRVRNTDPSTSYEAIEPNSLLHHSTQLLTAFYEQHQERNHNGNH
jgi:hypothetical protein